MSDKHHATRGLTESLMAYHGLISWTFREVAKSRAGQCRYGPKVIQLSWYYVGAAKPEDIRDTILHEIAHAMAGHEAGHGPHWKHVAKSIGARPERCYDSASVAMPKGKWRALCPSCAKVFHMHRRPGSGKIYWCLKCGKEFEEITNVNGS